jgi:uncharacterized protein
VLAASQGEGRSASDVSASPRAIAVATGPPRVAWSCYNPVPMNPGGRVVISKDLLDILVCPADKKELVLEDDFLRCSYCGRRYPIRDGIPVMLIEEGDKFRVEQGQTGGKAQG